jgi:hypothetical protein
MVVFSVVKMFINHTPTYLFWNFGKIFINCVMKHGIYLTSQLFSFAGDGSVFSLWLCYSFTGMDVMTPLASIRMFQQVPASMKLYLLGVQEWLASLGHLTVNTSIPALCFLAQCESHKLAMQPGRSGQVLKRLLKETAVTSMVNTSVLWSMICPQTLCITCPLLLTW